MSEPFMKSEDQYLVIDSWTKEDPQLVAGFTTKNGGVSQNDFQTLNMGFHVNDRPGDVKANRHLVADGLSFPLDCWVGAEQTHETSIQRVRHSDVGRGAAEYASSFKRTDGFYTSDKNILLTLMYADCVPILFYAPNRGFVGVAHAGWKGTVGEIAPKMVKALQGEGISANEIFVVIGPSICQSCYVVDDKVIDNVQKLLEEYDEKPYTLISDGQYQLDLKRLNAFLLEKAGILKSHIEVSTYCTSCHEDLFFSHRRDKGRTGRLMGFIGWKGDIK
jgi:YfiH family protein